MTTKAEWVVMGKTTKSRMHEHNKSAQAQSKILGLYAQIKDTLVLTQVGQQGPLCNLLEDGVYATEVKFTGTRHVLILHM